jgi:hypothetical protein
MKLKYLRIAAFMVAALFATGLAAQAPILNPDPNPGGAGGVPPCQTCFASGSGSFAAMGCVTPYDTGWGTDACWVESYPEQTYCFSVGHDCCVD